MSPETRESAAQPMFEEIVKKFESTETFQNLSSSTRNCYGTDYLQFIRFNQKQALHPHGNSNPQNNITAWFEELKSTGTLPATIDRKRSSMLRVLRWAEAEGIINNEYRSGIPDSLPFEYKVQPHLTSDDVDRLMSLSEKKLRDNALFSTMRATGAKVGELCVLNRNDISVTRERKLVIHFRGLGKSRERKLELDKEVAKKVVKYIKYYKFQPEEPLFQSFSGAGFGILRRGKRLTRQGVDLILKGYRKEMRTDKLNSRMIRDLFISEFQGNEKDLNEILGRR